MSDNNGKNKSTNRTNPDPKKDTNEEESMTLKALKEMQETHKSVMQALQQLNENQTEINKRLDQQQQQINQQQTSSLQNPQTPVLMSTNQNPQAIHNPPLNSAVMNPIGQTNPQAIQMPSSGKAHGKVLKQQIQGPSPYARPSTTKPIRPLMTELEVQRLRDRRNRFGPISHSETSTSSQFQEQSKPNQETLSDNFLRIMKEVNTKYPEEYEKEMEYYMIKVNKTLEKYPDEKTVMFTKSSLKMKRNFNLCQLYQTGDCKKEEHTHPEIVREIIDGTTTLNTKILLHMCDICSRYRNAYPQHAGFECEFIQDLQDREKDPEYKPRFMKKKNKK